MADAFVRKSQRTKKESLSGIGTLASLQTRGYLRLFKFNAEKSKSIAYVPLLGLKTMRTFMNRAC